MQARGALILFVPRLLGLLGALVYQVLWTRLLGLAFGTTTEAIGTVLAVFFGGLALGNLLAARGWTLRLRHPLRAYALLELAMGVFAGRLAAGGSSAWRVSPGSPAASWLRPFAFCSRGLVAAALLAPPDHRHGGDAPAWSRAVSSTRMPASGGPARGSTRRTRSAPSWAPICAASG